MTRIKKSDVIRIGTREKKRLEGMAAASGMSIREVMEMLVNNADRLGVTITRKVNFNALIDAEHERRIEQYPTVAQAEQEGLK